MNNAYGTFKLLTIFIAHILSLSASSQNFQWAKSLGGGGHDLGHVIATDGEGNIYTTGGYSDTADFDPGTEVFNLDADVHGAIFISKLDPDGNFIWAKSIVGSNALGAYSLAVDEVGNIYITGQLYGVGDFDPGPDIHTLTSQGNFDIFICKLNAAGEYVWAKNIGGTENEWATEIRLDDVGNIYFTGTFEGTVDFDLGTDTHVLTAVPGTIHTNNIFVAKFDSFGNYIWAKHLGSGESSSGYALALDHSGNVYTAGYFFGTSDFDPGPDVYDLTSDGGSDVFLSKLDASGNFVSALGIGGAGYEWAWGDNLAVDNTDHVYLTGSFQSLVDFDPGPDHVILSAEGEDSFICKLDASGKYVWAKNFRSVNDTSYSQCLVAIDDAGNVYLTGGFIGTVDFNPSSDNYERVSTAYSADIFITALNPQGDFLWAKTIGGIKEDIGYGLTLDKDGNVLTTGAFQEFVDFDADDGKANLTSNGFSDIFVLKLGMTTETNEILKQKGFEFYPNPSRDFITIESRIAERETTYSISDLSGRVLISDKLYHTSNGIDVSQLAAGMYFLHLGRLPEEVYKFIKL